MPKCRSWSCVNRYLSSILTRLATNRTQIKTLQSQAARAHQLELGLEWYTSCQEQGGKAKWTWVGDEVVVECAVTVNGQVTKYRNGVKQ